MLDVTSYTDKLPTALNITLKSLTGGECVLVRKLKEKDKYKLKGKSGNCHINVRNFIDSYGGSAVSGWLLNRIPKLLESGLYVWSFHSVWKKSDGKLLDVTDDKHYAGRDKSIFVPDSSRAPDLESGIGYNNFLVFTERAFAEHYGRSIGFSVQVNTAYWCDNTMLRLLEISEHSGVYRLINSQYPENQKMMCDEYEVDIIEGQPKPRPGSKYEKSGVLPSRFLFDYSVSSIA